jgi:metal-responsive CopG/Arc/MetJ family transcriptional regulator
MANSPHPETVTVSFTLPRQLSEAVNAMAKREMTNKSDIIRRAILAYLPAGQSAQIVNEVAGIFEVTVKSNSTPRN